MYQTCMLCNESLQTNEVVEEFPVGRRLAFDAANGRLWVVCRKCQRWNLTPMEERWEAVETCEKLFRGTRIRTSSENIGLARHPEGLELVRIGKPLRPEFAAWRYGDQFAKRRHRLILGSSAIAAAVAGGGAVGGVAGAILGINSVYSVHLWTLFRPSVVFRPTDGRVRRLSLLHLRHSRVRPADNELGFRVQTAKGVFKARRKEWFAGEDARRAINAVLPKLNGYGGNPKTVQAAVAEIESHGDPREFVSTVAARPRVYNFKGVPGHLSMIGYPTRLALEMALHEEDERRALEGELWKLEQAWREAEEIAGIADNLLLPEGTDEFAERHSAETRNQGER